MILYLPERIYHSIKNDERYQLIQTFLEERVLSISSVQDMFISEHELDILFQQKYNQQSYVDIRQELVNQYCKQYANQYEIVTHPKNKEDLLKDYEHNKNIWDTETKLYCLSNIIAQAYLDRTEFFYYPEYIKIYENNRPEEYEILSQYCHLKYFRAKVESGLLDIIYRCRDYSNEILHECYDYINKIKNIIHPNTSLDFLNNQIFNMFIFLIQRLFMQFKKDDFISQNVYTFNWDIDNYQHQYIDCCFNYANFLFTQLRYLIETNNFLPAYTQLCKLSDYINHSFESIQHLYRGCIQFDLEQQSQYMSLTSFLLFLDNLYPHLALDLSNITNQDKNYIISYKYLSSNYNESLHSKNVITNDAYINDIKEFLKNKVYIFSIMNN
jgi:hypothetical protein